MGRVFWGSQRTDGSKYDGYRHQHAIMLLYPILTEEGYEYWMNLQYMS
ncbi:hypothetical protein PEC311524_15090 [Pectobacterium carotovorum subsp. carotovorum]|nr:hypothetical protein PEC311524_15090 [Pectobacterium carotovorum subsp. carotovorum]